MATSGSYNLSSSYGTIRVEWWKISHNVNNNTTRIGWRAVATWSGSTWLQVYACRIWINGAQVLNRGSAQTWGGQFASGELDIGMNSDGNKNFGSNGEAAIYTAALNAYGSGSWDLPQVPRASQPSVNSWPNSTPDVNLGDNITVHMNRASDSFTHTVTVTLNDPADGGSFTKTLGTGVTNNVVWNSATDKDAIYSRNRGNRANSMYVNGYITVTTYQGGTNLGTKTTPIYFHFTNPSGEMNPLFADYTFEDTNSATVAITGDNQYIIQGQSQLSVTIPSAEKMVAQKSATADFYRFQIGSINVTEDYVATDITKLLGTVGVNSSSPLVVTAVDSRGLTKQVTKTINVLPYQVPQLNPVAQRVNNFETSTTINVTGVIARLTMAGTDKNAVNATNGLQYRYKKTDTATWGAWNNIATSTSGGNVSMTEFNVNLDRNFAWNVEFKLSDKIATTTVAVLVGVGIPIFRIGADGKTYNNEQPLMPSHVGQVIMSTTLTTPAAVSAIYGGTWSAFGMGRTIVGVDTGQTEFNTVEKTGGAKTHTLTIDEIPSHRHSISPRPWTATGAVGGTGKTGIIDWGSEPFTSYVGGGGAHNNLQPYVTLYMWKRTI